MLTELNVAWLQWLYKNWRFQFDKPLRPHFYSYHSFIYRSNQCWEIILLPVSIRSIGQRLCSPCFLMMRLPACASFPSRIFAFDKEWTFGTPRATWVHSMFAIVPGVYHPLFAKNSLHSRLFLAFLWLSYFTSLHKYTPWIWLGLSLSLSVQFFSLF